MSIEFTKTHFYSIKPSCLVHLVISFVVDGGYTTQDFEAAWRASPRGHTRGTRMPTITWIGWSVSLRNGLEKERNKENKAWLEHTNA
jgi:hypothetical protein